MMKYLLRVVFCLFCLFSVAFADVMPHYTGSISVRSIGFLKVPKQFNVYLFPRLDAKIVETIDLYDFEVKTMNGFVEPQDVYVVQLDSKNLAFCMVTDEQDGWYEIIYDKKNNKTGWIKPEKEQDFYKLRDFYTFFGKANGLYYMKNIDYHKRGLYSGAYANSQKIDGFNIIKSIKLHKISGNWALVTVLDIDAKPKIGYIRWREDDGNIIVFPKMK